MRSALIHLPRHYKRGLLALNDLIIIELCLLLAFYFRLNWWPDRILDTYWPVFFLTPAAILLSLYKLDLYSSVTRHAGGEVLQVLARGVSIGALVVLLIFFLYPISPPLPRSVLLLSWVLIIIAGYYSRVVAGRWLHGAPLPSLMMELAGLRRATNSRAEAVAVYGAGDAGKQLVRALQRGNKYLPIAFLDDDRNIQGEVVAGLKVYSPSELAELASEYSTFNVFLALPSVGRARRQQIIRFLEPFDVHVRSVPSMEELAHGLVSVGDIREVEVADILGRDIVPADKSILEQTIAGKVIAVTGAGGSIGAELCRQILRFKPAVLLLLDHSEYSLYSQYSEIEDKAARLNSATRVVPIIGSVTDGDHLIRVFKQYRPEVVFHGAAYKHVPLVEDNSFQGFVNNVYGTLETARAAITCGVERFVLISTDKAVRPTNFMGVTKRLSELLLQALSKMQLVDFTSIPYCSAGPSEAAVPNKTCFTMVRFGNVLDSSGSVIPKFRKQIRQGGPVTVTHPNVTRYFMTIPEAAELVLQANGLSSGGDIFLLEMGKPVKIDDLARKLIHLSGLTLKDDDRPNGDIEISYTGIRPGEKLFEELLVDGKAESTSHPKIKRANESTIPWTELIELLVKLEAAFKQQDEDAIRQLLSRKEVDYRPTAR